MERYLESSKHKFEFALNAIEGNLINKFILYGAGSHTARLIPILQDKGLFKNVIAIVDNNQNLHGVKLEGIEIISSSKLENYKNVPILISSHKAENAIFDSLRKENAIKFYGENR